MRGDPLVYPWSVDEFDASSREWVTTDVCFIGGEAHVSQRRGSTSSAGMISILDLRAHCEDTRTPCDLNLVGLRRNTASDEPTGVRLGSWTARNFLKFINCYSWGWLALNPEGMNVIPVINSGIGVKIILPTSLRRPYCGGEWSIQHVSTYGRFAVRTHGYAPGRVDLWVEGNVRYDLCVKWETLTCEIPWLRFRGWQISDDPSTLTSLVHDLYRVPSVDARRLHEIISNGIRPRASVPTAEFLSLHLNRPARHTDVLELSGEQMDGEHFHAEVGIRALFLYLMESDGRHAPLTTTHPDVNLTPTTAMEVFQSLVGNL